MQGNEKTTGAPRICEICGRAYTRTRYGRLKYCSPECAEIGRRSKRGDCAYYQRRKQKIRKVQTRGVYRPADVPVAERVVNGVRMQCRGRCCGAVGARRLLDGGW